MLTEIIFIINFIVSALWHIWPYLLLTIPLAVTVNMSGASKYIHKAFIASPMVAIVLATLVGAFSPFCSCSVIPVVATLLISGVPLAPVMAFWIASPSMDPEMFFLSVAMLGWELAVWRMIATLVLSLSAGFITHYLMQRGWFGETILRENKTSRSRFDLLIQNVTDYIRDHIKAVWNTQPVKPLVSVDGSSFTQQQATNTTVIPLTMTTKPQATSGCTPATQPITLTPNPSSTSVQQTNCGCGGNSLKVEPIKTSFITEPITTGSVCQLTDNQELGCGCQDTPPTTFKQRLWKETWSAITMVLKFMVLAFFLEALIVRYVPQTLIVGMVGGDNWFAIITAALIGIPVYTSNLSALPMISGLLTQGMSPAAALAFLVAGPTTTLPAMTAVWGLATRRVFIVYVAFALIGAVVMGYIYQLAMLI